jgi:hypothetical protein
MRANLLKPAAGCFATSLVILLSLHVLAAWAGPSPEEASEQVVACRVLEAHTIEQLRVTAVIFHQRDAKDRDRLSELLRRHAEAPVEVQTAGGAWNRATVARLKSCFGRGLLLLPLGAVFLTEKDEFLLKFLAN